MGAETFRVTARAKTASEAFETLYQKAKYDHGHAGYTGTIAEKPGFRIFETPEGMTPKEFIQAIESDKFAYDEKVMEYYDDKWAVAVCVQVEEDLWTFLGCASS
jgi:hypothetical protein